ncbi:MAG: type VI secretion system baseplate subunit TssK [Candidatus Zixiibacteriota bacterium]|nr:MAG: type VI secretion system baseplate subunit TssK [candidate division Zixibacteria bacterium]
MLVTQQNLKDQEKYFEDLIRWHSINVGDFYGLVKKSLTAKPALSLNLLLSGRRLSVEVDRCQAVTPDGHYIEITESAEKKVKAEADVTEGLVSVYIGLEDGRKAQVGEADPGEDIPRVPFLNYDYVLHVGDKPKFAEGQYIKLAELKVSEGEVTYSDNYYPPCLSLHADERLNQKVNDFKNRLEKLITLSSQAYMGISTEDSASGTSLQSDFRETVGRFVQHLASSQDQLIAGRNASHPLMLFIHFKRLFRVFSTLMNLHPGLKDYINERFFAKQTSTDINRYMSSIDSFLLSEYNHNNLGGHITAIDDLFATLRELLGFFAEVRKDQLGPQAMATQTMTYQGKTYSLADYSSCRLEKVGELNYLLLEITQPIPMSDAAILMSKDLFPERTWSNMQVRLGLNQARGLGETDPVTVDTSTFGNKVALCPQDMMKSSQVNQITLIFRGAGEAEKLASLGKTDLIIYAL